MTDPIKQRIIELVPEIVVNPHAQLIGHDRKVTYFAETRSITLADILLAIGKSGHSNSLISCMIHKDGVFSIFDMVWNLLLDYDNQTDETKASIGTLLGISNVTG